MDPWSTIGAKFVNTDPNYLKLVAAKKALKLLKDHSDVVVKLCIACADNDVFGVKEALSDDKSVINKPDSNGITPLVYAVCFKQKECVDVLLALGADVEAPDTCIGWTPLIWATYFDSLEIADALVGGGADPLRRPATGKQNAVEVAKPGSRMEEYFKTHGYVSRDPLAHGGDGENNGENGAGKSSAAGAAAGGVAAGDFYRKDPLLPQETDEEAAFKAQMKLQAMNISGTDEEPDTLQLHRITSTDSHRFVDDPVSEIGEDANLAWDTFDFNVVLDRQYVRVTDDSISSTIDFIFTLYGKYPTKPIYPATVMFMCLRYASDRENSPEMVQSLIELFLTRVRTETGTKSGALQYEADVGAKKHKSSTKVNGSSAHPDIVTLGYWIGVLNHLLYFVHRDVCGFLRRYKEFLQTIVSTLHTLVVQLAYTLDSKLEDMVDGCLLEYSSVPDLEAVYQNEWRIFHRKKPAQKTTYREIIDMLYPPTLDQQMKPSPLKVIQTLGALLYVMELFHINDELCQQCFTLVLSWLGGSVFNRVLANKKYCSRVRALQIRLNLSYIQDWLRANNLKPFVTSDINFKDSGYPDVMINEEGDNKSFKTSIQGVARFHGSSTNASDATFYFQDLYRIGQVMFGPAIQLLEWLQVFTGLKDEASLKDTIDNFQDLNSTQLLRVVKNYKYEVEEPHFAKGLNKWLKKYPFDAKNESMLHYTSGTEEPMFLDVGQAYPLALPGYLQLLHQYGVDLDGVDDRKVRRFQPNLPVEAQDDLDNILDQYGNLDDTAADDDALKSVKSHTEFDSPTGAAANIPEPKKTDLFNSLKAPTSIAHKTWATNTSEQNPWA